MNKIIKKQEIKPKIINKYILKDEYLGGGGQTGKVDKNYILFSKRFFLMGVQYQYDRTSCSI